MAGADRAMTAPLAIDHRQARRLMFVEFPADVINWLVLVATRGRRFHDFSNADFRALAIIRRHAATHVTLGDDSDQLASLGILDNRRAAASGFTHGLRRVDRSVFRRTARRRLDWFHHIATAAHFVLLVLINVSAFVVPTVGFDLVNRRFTRLGNFQLHVIS